MPSEQTEPGRPSRSCRLHAIAVVIAVALAAGCQSAHVSQPLTSAWAGNEPHARAEFWYQLANRPVTSNDEAFHGVLLYLDGTDTCADYPARVRELQRRAMLPGGFKGTADEAANRGTVAVALAKGVKVKGGLTMQLLGPSPRYAVRALEYQGIFPASSPNQGLTGGEFVGIMQKAEEFEHGSPAEAPAAFLPGEINHEGGPIASAMNAIKLDAAEQAEPIDNSNIAFAAVPPGPDDLDPHTMPVVAMCVQNHLSRDIYEPASNTWYMLSEPLFLDDLAGVPAPPPANAPKKMNVIITGVEGDVAEVRKTEADPWVRARRGMVLHESAEFRTGPKSAIRFIIPPDQTICVDSQTTMTLAQAVADGKKLKTDIEMSHGRVRYDVAKLEPTSRPVGPIQIEEAGLSHDAVIRSPNSALALRGTKVSLFEQPAFIPEAVSLTGRAIYVNTRGERVPFGGTSRADIRGDQTSAAQQASANASSVRSSYLALADFETREISIVTQRGGFIKGDVIVGDLHLSDFPKLPGSLDFVLQWTGGSQQALNDLNLAVFSPQNTTTSPDFVANPPFLVSLTPNSPSSKQLRASNYPQSSRTGGQISFNSIGPDGLELAFWPKNYPVGNYQVVVFNLIDAKPPPSQTTNPVTYTIDVFLNGAKLINTFTGSIGFLETSSALVVPVPASGSSALARKPATVRRQAAALPTVVAAVRH